MDITVEFANQIGYLVLSVIEKHAITNFQNLNDSQIFLKNNGQDIVTEIDLAIEAELSQHLQASLAGSFILGEEGYAEDASIVKQAQNYSYVWVIDPLDGTRNFSQGIEIYSSMVALCEQGKVVLGVLYDCLERDVAIAIAGLGAYYLKSSTKISAIEDDRFVEITGLIGHFPPRLREELLQNTITTSLEGKDIFCQNMNIMQRIATMKHVKSLRCAGMDFIGMAKGERHFSVYNSLKSWDHAAGKLLLEEAGGIFQAIGGNISPYNALEESGRFLAVYSTSQKERLMAILCLE